MERVQFEQEGMVGELRDLVERGVFTEAETKQIMRKRTGFESALVRRVAKKGDFLRYIAFESGLEALLRKRMQRLNIQGGSHVFVKRQNAIFERAVKKFKSDIGLWIEYIDHAKSQRAPALVGRIAARALNLHPSTPSLYILLASHEMEANHSPDAARKILQRGLRINGESGELWVEYVKMEMWFGETVRRRKTVLGIEGEGTEDQDDEERNKEEEEEEEEDALVQVVKVVIEAALAKLNAEWREKLKTAVETYPVPDRIRDQWLVFFE